MDNLTAASKGSGLKKYLSTQSQIRHGKKISERGIILRGEGCPQNQIPKQRMPTDTTIELISPESGAM